MRFLSFFLSFSSSYFVFFFFFSFSVFLPSTHRNGPQAVPLQHLRGGWGPVTLSLHHQSVTTATIKQSGRITQIVRSVIIQPFSPNQLIPFFALALLLLLLFLLLPFVSCA